MLFIPRCAPIIDDEIVNMIKLIEVRARFRTHDDVLALSTTNIKRIHQVVELYAFDRSQIYSAIIANWGLVLLEDYYQNALEYQYLLADTSDKALEALNYSIISPNSNSSDDDNNKSELIMNKVDGIINDTLDIQLSAEAQRLDLPPTINEDMINNLVIAWLPEDVVRDQRRVLDELIGAGMEFRDNKKRKELEQQLDSIAISPEVTVDLIGRLELINDENQDNQE